MPQTPAHDTFTLELKTLYEERFRVQHHLVGRGAEPHEAEDATQSALLSIWSRRPRMENPYAYLLTAARHNWANMARTNSRSKLTGLKVQDSRTDCPTKTPENRALASADRQRLLAAFKRLPLSHREAFVLHTDEQLTFGETAELTGRTESTVRQHHKRAVSTLRRLLKE